MAQELRFPPPPRVLVEICRGDRSSADLERHLVITLGIETGDLVCRPAPLYTMPRLVHFGLLIWWENIAVRTWPEIDDLLERIKEDAQVILDNTYVSYDTLRQEHAGEPSPEAISAWERIQLTINRTCGGISDWLEDKGPTFREDMCSHID